MLPDSGLLRSGTSPHGQVPTFASHLPTPSLSATFKLDEGYSEETRSQAGSDVTLRSPSPSAETSLLPTELGLPAWVPALAETDRSGMR